MEFQEELDSLEEKYGSFDDRTKLLDLMGENDLFFADRSLKEKLKAESPDFDQIKTNSLDNEISGIILDSTIDEISNLAGKLIDLMLIDYGEVIDDALMDKYQRKTYFQANKALACFSLSENIDGIKRVREFMEENQVKHNPDFVRKMKDYISTFDKKTMEYLLKKTKPHL